MRNLFRAAPLVMVLALGSVPATAGSRTTHPVARALAFFHGSEADRGDAVIRRLRPAPLSPALRAAVVASLPAEGELEPEPAERAKIAALDAIFDMHERKGLVVVKVIEVGHAFVGLHARTVLLLSRDALSILDAEELQALAAHELGHELFWDEYQAARAQGEHAVTQELELRCDGIAVATLVRLGRGPDPLARALRKMTRYNEARGATASAANYVSLKERARFIGDVAALLAGRAPDAVSRRLP